MAQFKCSPDELWVARNDSSAAFNAKRRMPHIISKFSTTVSFSGVTLNYAGQFVFQNQSPTGYTVYAIDGFGTSTHTLDGNLMGITGLTPVFFARITPQGGANFAPGLGGKWFNVQGTLVTRLFGSSANFANRYPAERFAGGEIYTFNYNPIYATIEIRRTLIIAGSFKLEDTRSIGVAGFYDSTGQTRSVFAPQYASTVEIELYLCR